MTFSRTGRFVLAVGLALGTVTGCTGSDDEDPAPTAATGQVEMTNLLGEEAADWRRLAADPDARLHLYGKREMVPGRKMGHVNRVRPLERG